MQVTAGSGLLSSTIAPVSRALGPLRGPICVMPGPPACRARSMGEGWAVLGSGLRGFGKLLRKPLRGLPRTWIMLAAHGDTLRTKGVRSVPHRERRSHSFPFPSVL